MQRFTNRVALVTGAARGIGAACAERLHAEGATVWVTDIRDDDGAALAARLGARARYATLDVRDEAAWTRVLAEVHARDGALDVLVANAGITGFEDGPVPHDPEHVSLDAWRAVLATNLDGVMLACRAAIGAMKTRGGSIVIMASRSGLVGIPGAAAYAAGKAAIRNHAKTVALYCAERGYAIRCNAVFPAAILTPMWEPMLGPPGPARDAAMAAIVHDVPLRRMGTVAEVAAAVAYLASDEAAYTTGAELVLDGGLLAGASAPPPPPTEP
ncbi:MAG: SDR family oxidoreductase [Gemmatimonadaceae bacterium]|jgi:NAD(P)-dependent dehydrogenase (short-subunit alcohol dehydrogenase family)|nr:SDR family oxidoreductase [Gemmatimonadaceae bacterium]